MLRCRRLLTCYVLLVVLPLGGEPAKPSDATAFLAVTALLGSSRAVGAELDFAHQVAPILRKNCGDCHTGPHKKGGLSLNTRESTLQGGESGAAAVPGKLADSELWARVSTDDKDLRMPPDGAGLSEAERAVLRSWIEAGVPWEAGFSFGPRGYEPPLQPRRPVLPPAVAGRTHPVDRILDAYFADQQIARPPLVDDDTFARRAYLDLIGLAPTPAELAEFRASPAADKRRQLVLRLLGRETDYAEHWLTFWNDLLRNDYSGTGFITNGRTQISAWLYGALVTNKRFDEFTRELIAPPSPDSAGFANGIRWRGDVSAGQTVEIQFAQSVGQAFLGINLKCASCHDSFIDRWTLQESYALAAVYSSRPLEVHRCDKPTGMMAQPGWLFPELGSIDAAAPPPERLKQLAALMTHPDNGRWTRTVVNRFWHRLFGRGLVHPVDAMQTEPWNADLLDFLATELAAQQFDLKKIIELIATSEAYQMQAEIVAPGQETAAYRFRGPRAKRLTAEQLVDVVWQLTGAAPFRFDAPVLRGKPDTVAAERQALVGEWLWTTADFELAPAGETATFRKSWELKSLPRQAVAVVTCDNSFQFFLNGRPLSSSDDWEQPALVMLTDKLKVGNNEILVVAKNGGGSPNPAGLFFEARGWGGTNTEVALGSDGTWEFSRSVPNKQGKFAEPPADWQPAVVLSQRNPWTLRLNGTLRQLLSQDPAAADKMVRAALLKSDFLMRSLGRPNREQIVSERPNELTTLEAIDLSNGPILAGYLERGARQLRERKWASPADLVTHVYRQALSRDPQPAELAAAVDLLGPDLADSAIADLLWATVMLPEFQLVR